MNPTETNQSLVSALPDHSHNKSLVIGPVNSKKEGQPMTIYLNEMVSQNNTVSNNIIVVAADSEIGRVKETLESSNASFVNNVKTEESRYRSTKNNHNIDETQAKNLTSKQSTVEKKADEVIQSYDPGFSNNYQLKFPDVSAPPFKGSAKTGKHADHNKNYIKFEVKEGSHVRSKLLPSITNKNGSTGIKRTPKNRDMSMTVIKSGRLALQDESINFQDVKKNTSMSRGYSKNKNSIQFPLNRKEACIALEEYLYEVEQLEILDYDKIYYFNCADRKSKKLQQPEGEFNNGFDNQHGDYRYTMTEHISYRYELIKELGKGSFGVVIKAFDHMCKEFVALKILRNRKKLHTQGLIEIKLIQDLNNDDLNDRKNIVRLKESFKFRNHICITFELLSINLYDFIKNNDFRGVSLRLTKRFAIQILVSLIFMAEHNTIH